LELRLWLLLFEERDEWKFAVRRALEVLVNALHERQSIGLGLTRRNEKLKHSDGRKI
jgi:hypothetical protein